MPKIADQADATTREILGPQFAAMRNLVNAVESNREKAEALAKAQNEHTDSTSAVVDAYDAAKAAGFTTGQLKNGGYSRPSLKAAAKPVIRRIAAPTEQSASADAGGGDEERRLQAAEQSIDDQQGSEYHDVDRQDGRNDDDALAS
ncbi:hypothetical protein [Rhodococcoides fascians]|uniref:hypothetical protein n=1 Tax=Rhodococcoides fascians TaxID=1828 RepID=UPI00366D21A7